MKRVKIMLLSLTLLAIVGGALAFKAKFDIPTCYTSTYIAGLRTTCTLNADFKFDEALEPKTYYTTDPVFWGSTPRCYTTNQINQQLTDPLICDDTFTTSTLD